KIMLIYRSWHSNYIKIRLFKFLPIRSKINITSIKVRRFQLLTRIFLLTHHLYSFFTYVKAYNFNLSGKLKCNGQANITESNDGQLGVFIHELLIHFNRFFELSY